ASREAVRVALAAEVAKSYFSLRSFEQQVLLTRQTLDLREEALGLQRKRRDAGVIGDYELRQLEAEAAAARAQLPGLEQAREREEVALQLLLGRDAKQVFETQIARREGPDAKLLAPVLPAGMPSELLLRRPDLVQAERSLAAANARVAVARAEMFPSISLTGALGSQSAALSNLFAGGAGIWTLAAAVSQPIFSGGRTEARTEAARASARRWRSTSRQCASPLARCATRSWRRPARARPSRRKARAPMRSPRPCASRACATRAASRASSRSWTPSAACSMRAPPGSMPYGRTAPRSRTSSGHSEAS